MFYIGIDPGFLGALGVVDDKGRAAVHDTPFFTTGSPRRTKGKATTKIKREYDIIAIKNLVKPYAGQAIALIEQVGSRPDQGVASMFSMGYGVGIWEMCLLCHGIPMTRINPLKWKNIMLEGVGHEKEGSMLRASQLWPHIDLHGKMGGDRDGRAEALLLAECARRRRFKGEM